MTDWLSIVEGDELECEICDRFNIDYSVVGDADTQEVLVDSAFVLCLRNLVLNLVKYGFTNLEIEDAVHIAVELFDRLVHLANQHGLSSELETFIDIILQNSHLFSPTKLTKLVEYLQSDLIQHINLYKFCAIGQRDSAARVMTLEVNTVPSDKIVPLKQGQKKDICLYERAMKEIEEKEQAERAAVVQQKLSKESEMAHQKTFVTKKIDGLIADCPKYEDVLQAINEVARYHADVFNANVGSTLDLVELDLRRKLEKTALPRPVKLGAPPRFKLKPAIQIVKAEQSEKIATKVERKSSTGSASKQSSARQRKPSNQ